MILKGDKALAFCRKPDVRFNIVFLHGDDAGVAVDAARELANAWKSAEADELEESRLLDEEVKRDPATLGDALTARPLFGGRQLIRLNLTNDTLFKPIAALLSLIDKGQLIPEAYLIVTGEGLGPKSKVKAAFEGSKHVACMELASDSEADLSKLVTDFMITQNVEIEPDALDVFIQELPGDRRLANTEMEKLSLYATDLGRPVDASDIELVSATERKLGAEDAADAALAGEVKLAITATDRFLDSGGSPISGLRTMHFRLLRVLDALSGERFLRPRVNNNEKASFNKMLKSWNAARVSRALSMLYAAELSCKQAGAPVEAIFKIVIDRISRRAV